MIKALIIDDEPSAINTLRLMLDRYVPQINRIEYTIHPSEGLELIDTFQPDILFLDIQMPGMNGFTLLKELKTINFTIIFTTAYDQYAIEAIRFSALDYLLKPIDADELKNAFSRYVQYREKMPDPNAPLYQNLLNNIHAVESRDFKLALPTAQGTFFYRPDEIIRIEGESNYSKFYFTSTKTLVISKTLKEYETLLANHHFLRVHKSHLVNINHIANCSNDGILSMHDNSIVEISRRRREEVLQVLKNKK